MEKYALRTFVPRGSFFHLHRTEIGKTHSHEGHIHGYAEVFWVEEGSLWHIRNGNPERLRAGDVAWLREGESHSFRGAPRATIINLAFDDSVLTHLEKRYYSRSNPAPWRDPLNHSLNHLNAERLATFRHLAYSLAFGPQNRLAFETFLLNLLESLSAGNERSIFPEDDCPAWLKNAVRQVVKREMWNITSREFAKLAGRSAEHISRTVRKFSGKTTSELLNGYRLEKAAADLCMTNKAVLEISMNAGFENLGYFYRLFKKHFNQSPGKFRRSHQALVLRA